MLIVHVTPFGSNLTWRIQTFRRIVSQFWLAYLWQRAEKSWSPTNEKQDISFAQNLCFQRMNNGKISVNAYHNNYHRREIKSKSPEKSKSLTAKIASEPEMGQSPNDLKIEWINMKSLKLLWVTASSLQRNRPWECAKIKNLLPKIKITQTKL